VTLSDLQRLPVRTFLFGLFIHLELLLTQELKRRVGPNGAIRSVTRLRKQAVVEDWYREDRMGAADQTTSFASAGIFSTLGNVIGVREEGVLPGSRAFRRHP
jgi:hypothetical protein